MLADEDMARGRPGRLREPPRQLASRGDRVVILAGVLQHVGEEEECFVQPRRGAVPAQQLAIESDRLESRHLRRRPIALRGFCVVFRLGCGTHGDAEERSEA